MFSYASSVGSTLCPVYVPPPWRPGSPSGRYDGGASL